ncbi:MAG: polysaccharide biosynthesis protein [Methanohalophilus sp.]|nr:MAG: polysaccharide biosynthesis protein [Methanohalophilus sp.]
MTFFGDVISKIMGIGEIQRQGLISFSGQIIQTIIGFLSTMYFARILGADALGAYFLFMAYYMMIGMVTDGGIGGASIKRISEGKDQDAYFSAAFVLRLIVTLIILIIIVMLRNYFVDLSNAGVFSWLLIAFVLSLLKGPLYNGMAGCGKMGVHAAGNYFGDISRTILQIIAVFLGYGLDGLMGGFVAGIIASTIVSLPFFDLHLTKFGWKHVKNLSSFSFWLFLTSSGIMIYSYADRIIIGYFMNNADVGIYQIAVQLAAFASFATIALRSTLWPKVSSWGINGDFGLVEKSLSKAILYSLILAIPAFVGGVTLGNNLLYNFYGSEFSGGYLVLVIILLGQVANVFQYLFTMYLGALDFQKESFKATAIGTTGNIILNVLLIPLIGIDGAALATLITLALNSLLAGRYLSKIININLEYSSIVNIIIASATMGLCIGISNILNPLSGVVSTLLQVLIGAIIYSFFILKLDNSIKREFKEIATQIHFPWPSWV